MIIALAKSKNIIPRPGEVLSLKNKNVVICVEEGGVYNVSALKENQFFGFVINRLFACDEYRVWAYNIAEIVESHGFLEVHEGGDA